MTMIRRPSPFGDFLSLRQAMDRLFEDSFVNPRTWSLTGGGMAPLDAYLTEDELVVEASLPGVKPEEVDITVEGGVLTIQGEIKQTRGVEEGQAALVQEIKRGKFTRSISLPQGLEPDRASAQFEDGVLTLRIPKAEQLKPRQIKITADGRQGANTVAGEAK